MGRKVVKVNMKNSIKILFLISILVITTFSCQRLNTVFSIPLVSPNDTPPSQSTPLPINVSSIPVSQGLLSTPVAPDLVALQDALVNLYEKVNPGVVSIRVLTESGDGLGSGFVYDRDGHIVTNYHVAGEADQIRVIFADGTAVEATLVGADPDRIVAAVQRRPEGPSAFCRDQSASQRIAELLQQVDG